MTIYPGSCHCGAIRIAFASDRTPGEMRVGRCGCSFCRRHGARTLGEPEGALEFLGRPTRYRFALGITDYLLCPTCGTYLGAVMEDEGRTIGIVNVNAIDVREAFDMAPPLHHYDGESEERKRARRRKFWMPASVIA